jgi:hypothetical protein
MRGRWQRQVGLAIALLCGVLACCPSITVVAVPEARFRTENTSEDRLRVPLSDADRERLIRFLRSGGDRHRPRTVVADPNAAARYAELLALLQAPSLPMARFEAAPLFQHPCTDQIVDGREESPPASNRPMACTDGAYWWIAYPSADRVTGILVTRELHKHPELPGGGG